MSLNSTLHLLSTNFLTNVCITKKKVIDVNSNNPRCLQNDYIFVYTWARTTYSYAQDPFTLTVDNIGQDYYSRKFYTTESCLCVGIAMNYSLSL